MELSTLGRWALRLSALTTWLGAAMSAPIVAIWGPDLAMLAAMYGGQTEPARPEVPLPWAGIALALLAAAGAGLAEPVTGRRWLGWLSHAISMVTLALAVARWLEMVEIAR